jgi:hypothetical protein
MPRLFTLTVQLCTPPGSSEMRKKKTRLKPEFWGAKIEAKSPQATFIRTVLHYSLSVEAEHFNFIVSQKNPPTLEDVVEHCDELLDMRQMGRCCELVVEWLGRKKSREWLDTQEKKIICDRIFKTESYILQNMNTSELKANTTYGTPLAPSGQFAASICTRQSQPRSNEVAQLNPFHDDGENSVNNEEERVEENLDYYHDDCFSSYLPEFETSPNATPDHLMTSSPPSTYRPMVVTREDTTPLRISRTLSSDSINWLGGFDSLNVTDCSVGSWLPPEPIPYFQSPEGGGGR